MRYLLTVVILGGLLAASAAHAGKPLMSAPLAAGEARLLLFGDVMLGRYVGASMSAQGFDAPFKEVHDFLSSADLTAANLEGPLVDTSKQPLPSPSANQPLLTGDARAAGALARVGFDLVSLANNHSSDAGDVGLRSTVDALRSAGIEPLGVSGGRQAPVVRGVHGLRIAFLAYTAIKPDVQVEGSGVDYVDASSQADIARFSREIADARHEADAVVVFMHWGTQYSSAPAAEQRQLAQVAARAGANLVVGAHPHVVQGMEVLEVGGHRTLVAYSLGNALFDQTDPRTSQGFALSCVLDSDGVREARLIPVQTSRSGDGFVLQVADGAAGQATVQSAAQSTPAELQWREVWDIAQQPGLALAYLREDAVGEEGTFENLGLGSPSIAQLNGGRLTVGRATSQGLQTVWRTELNWRVTSYTVGDANGDGQPDLIYSVWKPSLVWQRPPGGGMSVQMEGGPVRPHLYINTWRDGEMRPLWHGSPRPAPLLGEAVAPVGPGGKTLLATLQSSDPQREQAPGKIQIWQWSGGFGFELTEALPGVYSQVWSDGRALLFK